jgi:hypothetical protein
MKDMPVEVLDPRTYDEAALISGLGRVEADARVAFAAACAERLFPAYEDFSRRARRGDPDVLAALLAQIWEHLISGRKMSLYEVGCAVTRSMGLIPRDEDGPWVEEQPYAENAAASVAFTLRALQTGKSQEAMWAARRAYEAVDHHVSNRLGIDSDAIVRAHPIVAAEAARQRRDLDELIEAHPDPIAARLRDRAKTEASALFRVRG